jgi:hypothetical protein
VLKRDKIPQEPVAEFSPTQGAGYPPDNMKALDLETKSAFVVLSFLLSPNSDFGNKTAVELLRAGRTEIVILEARSFLKHGA